jgi:hypothetical protein
MSDDRTRPSRAGNDHSLADLPAAELTDGASLVRGGLLAESVRRLLDAGASPEQVDSFVSQEQIAAVRRAAGAREA